MDVYLVSRKGWSEFMLCIPLCIQIWYYVHRQVTPANFLEVYYCTYRLQLKPVCRIFTSWVANDSQSKPDSM
jgi:hypothetical protein